MSNFDDDPDGRYAGHAMWELPNYLRVMVVFVDVEPINSDPPDYQGVFILAATGTAVTCHPLARAILHGTDELRTALAGATYLGRASSHLFGCDDLIIRKPTVTT